MRIINLTIAGLVSATILLIGLLPTKALAQPTYMTNFASAPQQSAIPFNNNVNNKAQWLYYSTDFGSPPSGFINKIYIKAASSMLPVINNLNDFTIKMGTTSLTALPPSPWITSNMSTVFFAPNLNIWPIPGNWMEITLQSPFYFTSGQKFIVETSQSSYSVGFDIMQGSLSARSLYGNLSSVMANSQNYLLDFGFTLTQGSTDASLEEFLNLDDSLCSGSRQIGVELKNNGPSTLTNVTIQWRVNNIAQTAYAWTGNLAANATTVVNIGNFNFSTGQAYTINANVLNPNNLADLNPANDSATFIVAHVKASPGAQPLAPAYMICPGDTVNVPIALTGTAPWNLTYSNGSSSVSIQNISSSPINLHLSPTSNKTYTITALSDASGCPFNAVSSFTVGINPKPNVNIGSDTIIKFSWSLVLNAGSGFTSYQWSTGGTGSSVQVSGASLGVGAHPVSVTVTNAYYCKDEDTVLVTVRDDTGLGESEGVDVRIFPNPATDCLHLDTRNCREEIVKMEMLSALGELAWFDNYPSIHSTFEINVHTFNPGIYVLRFYTKESVLSFKLLISH